MMSELDFQLIRSAFLGVFQTSVYMISALAAVLQLGDYWLVHRVKQARSFPMCVTLPVPYHSIQRLLDRFVEHLDSQRRMFDVVVGIHYGGLPFAADIARTRHKPVRLIETRFKNISGVTVCEDVFPRYTVDDIVGKHVLLVDNRIKSGLTLEMARRRLISDGALSVTTVVVFRPKGATGVTDFALLERRSKGDRFIR